MSDSPFLNPDPQRIFYRSDLVIAIWDAFRVSPGHALLIPRREVPTWFDATPQEQQALTQAITLAKQEIEKKHRPDGYNIGINAGAAAGQTVFHLHVHVIPRYNGDVDDPRGGVRHVIPDKGNYLAQHPGSSSLPEVPGHLAELTPPRLCIPHTRPRTRRAHQGTPELHAGTNFQDAALVKEAPTSTYDSRGTLITNQLVDHLSTDLQRAQSVDLAVSFLQPSGLKPLLTHFEDLLYQRQGRCRIITGDYLDITHPDALETLLNLAHDSGGRLQVRVFCSGPAQKGFHPKAYLFTTTAGQRTAYIGSSNLSHSALHEAVEWNYRVVDGRDPRQLAQVQLSFEELFAGPHSCPLTYEWLAAYRKRRKPLPTRAEQVVEVLDDTPKEPAQPHPIQQQALQALRHTREQGNKAGLVVLATGLGKTWLSAFDSEPYDRILFVAHREEILSQSMKTYRRIRPRATFGFYNGQEKSPHADILFASIQTLNNHLQAFDPKQFDYIVVDEFHHASAPTYRKVIDYFEPQFLLGLTATPERTDGGNLLALCGQNLVFRCDLAEGMQAGRLCPMHYYGVPDIVDYTNIPWRSTRFDPDELTTALATTQRAQNAIDQHRERGGERTVAFCCTTTHADFMAQQFNHSGVRAVAVHSGAGSANRTQSLQQLKDGELQVICCVDMFNEGVDLPQIDTVMLLRPTESRIIWLQQLGRGLRKAPGKEHLTVIDYIGNHRTFRLKLQTLVLELLRGKGGSDAELRKVLKDLQYDQLELPEGCEVTYELEAIEIMKSLLRPVGKDAALVAYYEEFVELAGERPTALEAYQSGLNPRAARGGYGSWFGFVQAMKGFSDEEARVWKDNQAWFQHLGKTAMSKSYKMVVLQALLSVGPSKRLDARHEQRAQQQFGCEQARTSSR